MKFSLPPSPFSVRSSRSAFTLIEMLVAVAITMIMMLAVTQLFLYLGDNMQKSRAIIEMSGQLRNVSLRLQEDLDGLTASTLPWTKPDAGDGYFEYVEGARNDRDTDGNGTIDTTFGQFSDLDDVLMFTARSKGKPFVGRHGNNVIESELAEIIWWVAWRDAVVDGGNGDTIVQPGEVTLHRRVLLIRPDLTPVATDDISQRVEGTTRIANSLADLTLRQNRALRVTNAGLPAAFPHPFNTSPSILVPNATGRETVLSNVVGFDVRVWDPLAPLMNGTNSILVPGDPSYNATTALASATSLVGRGAYVDLNYAGNRSISLYSGLPNVIPAHPTNPGVLTVPTYSTWPFYYEQDGVNQDSTADALVDEGTDGFDTTATPANAAVDDPGEYETIPPYPNPGPFTVPPPGVATPNKAAGLRGIQVRIRLAEPSSRQVRQSTVVAEFLPE